MSQFCAHGYKQTECNDQLFTLPKALGVEHQWASKYNLMIKGRDKPTKRVLINRECSGLFLILVRSVKKRFK